MKNAMASNRTGACEDPESFDRRGPTLTRLFLVHEGRKDPDSTISGPLSPCQRNAICVGVPMMVQH